MADMDNQVSGDHNDEIDLVELLKTVWSRRKYILKIAAIAVVVGAIIALTSPVEFTSTVKMAPEGDKSQSGNVSNLAALAGINMGSSSGYGIDYTLYPEIVGSTPFLADMMGTPVKGKKMTEPEPLYSYIYDDIKRPLLSNIISAPMSALGWIMSIGKKRNENEAEKINILQLTPRQSGAFNVLKERININVDKKTNIITVSVKMQDPVIAATLADSVISKLNDYITIYRTNKAKLDYEFIAKLYENATENYHVAQRKYATFADANRNISMEAVNIEKQRLQNEQQLAYNIYAGMTQQLENAKIKVQEQTPSVTIIEPAGVPVRKSNKSTMTYILAFAFLGAFIGTGIILVKHFLLPSRQS